MRSLSDYLNIEDTVKVIKEFTKISFFNEGNLFDLVVKEELQPVVYFEGRGSVSLNKTKSPYPEDFEDEDEDDELIIDNIWKGTKSYEQLNYVKGYFYLMHGENTLRAIKLTEHFQFEVKEMVAYKAIPNNGLNSKQDIYRKTLIYTGDFIMLSTYDDEIPSFTKDDIRFYVLDIINMVEKNGYYSSNEDKQTDNLADDKDLNPKDSAYHLIAVLKDLLLNPDVNAYHFKTDNSKSTNQPTQAGLAEYIDAMDIKGLKARNINGIFSQANRLLSDAQKR